MQKFFSISIFAAVFLSACVGKNLPDLAGRYVGMQTVLKNENQVVAQIPMFMFADGASSLEFQVYRTLGSADPETVRINIPNEKTIDVRFADLQITLERQGDCAKSNQSSLCLGASALDLEIDQNGEKIFTLHLRRDDSLPPIGDRNGRAYSLDELVGRARFQNYTVEQDAERVIQAKERMKAARGNLFPKISLRAVVGAFTGDYLSTVGAALPFLFPSNWYQWKASKAMYAAETKSFASLRGNEMNAVEGLYRLIARDQAVLSELEKHLTWMRSTQESLSKEEQAGTLPTGTADYFGTSVAALDLDRVNLETLVKSETQELAQSVALSPLTGITGLSDVEAPNLDAVKPIRAEEFFREAQKNSFEIAALQKLFEASRALRTGVLFEFLDAEGGGNLGFGTPHSFLVAKSQSREIQDRIGETYSLIELKSAEVENEHNAALEAYAIAKTGLASSRKRLDWLMKRHLTGDPTLDDAEFAESLASLQTQIFGFLADEQTAAQTWSFAKAKLDRLLLNGYYRDLDGALTGEQK